MDEARVWSAAPGGGERAIVAGERVLQWPDGSMAAAADRLPGAPTHVLELPERLGGGFFFAFGARIWRSDSWLGRAEPTATLAGPVGQLVAGLDRAYARTQSGAVLALDPRHGTPTELGPVPASPAVVRFAALDAWRAVAIADLRGVLLTLDAGATWRPLPLPIDATDLVLLDGAVAVGGTDEARKAQWWEVRPDGQIGHLPSAPSSQAESPPAKGEGEGAARAFGARPLAAAIEDGWPLTDGTAIVARDGAIGRVRLSDGALVESVPDAFALRPARCHAVSLARPRDPGAFGFVCGEARGRTVVYRWDATGAHLVELHRFEGPREVLASGNGALAARGACADDDAELPSGEQAWCLMPPGGAWTEMHFRGDDVERARLVVLADGRAALVRPPRGGDLSTARVTVTDGVHSSHAPIAWPQMRADVGHALRVGLWMDGFEERRPGVLGGWIDAAGSVLGIEIDLRGEARVGSYIRAAGDAFVSGRWGLGWMASRRGVETTDGGMTWNELELPEPIAQPRAVQERACGPIGCLAAGWMRVGWGAEEKAAAPASPQASHATSHGGSAPPLDLDCAPLATRPVEPKALPPARVPRLQPPVLVRPTSRWGGGAVLAPIVTASETLPMFSGRSAPLLGADEAGDSSEVTSSIERGMRNVSFARVYAWGPKGGDWDQLGRWQIRWLWPYGGWPEVRSSSVAPAPWTTIEAARAALGSQRGAMNAWSIAAGDDADHALLVARRVTSVVAVEVVALEADHPPMEVRRPGGEPFPDVEGATRAGGRWYLATQQPPGELPATIVWLVDGSSAREVARVARTTVDGLPATRLARRADGRGVALIVDGRPDAEGGSAVRWLVSIDQDSGTPSEPQPLAPADLSDRKVSLCTGDDAGWEVDVPYPGTVTVRPSGGKVLTLQAPVARLRLSRDHACVERMQGAIDPFGTQPTEGLARPGNGSGTVASQLRDARTIDVSLLSARTRLPLRCTRR
jgi:hypothetical protein